MSSFGKSESGKQIKHPKMAAVPTGAAQFDKIYSSGVCHWEIWELGPIAETLRDFIGIFLSFCCLSSFGSKVLPHIYLANVQP